MESRAPSGLFPAGPQRPVYREAHPVRLGAVMAGAGGAAGWLLLLGLLATSLRSYLWLTILGVATAWVAALALARFGDRGVAAGVAVSTAIGASIGFIVMIERWGTSGWPLW
jgi:hypothetical protein